MKKCLVTGGAGFIGSHIVGKLLEMGHLVTVIDNESSDGHDEYYWDSRATNHKVDITDLEAIKPLFKGIDVVYHLAAMVSVQESVEKPLPTFITNALGTANVLEASRLAGVDRFVYSSTSACYGENPVPSVEDMREDPLNTYAIGKLSGEHLVRNYHQLYGMKTVTFRYTNVYGDRSRHTGSYAPVISIFLKQKRAGQPLTICGDGLQKRDFIHVDDVSSANCFISYGNMDRWGETYNVGYGENWTIKEIADAISDEQVHLPARDGEMKETLADITKIKQDCIWKPKVNVFDWIRSKV